MASSTVVTTAQILELLENEDQVLDSADVFITPPDDGDESAEDSADEDLCGTVNNLSGKQLQTEAVSSFKRKGHLYTIGNDAPDNESCSSSSDDCISPPKKSQPRKKRKLLEKKRTWKKTDLVPDFKDFHIETKRLHVPSDPVSYFELFFDDEICDYMKTMFILYAREVKGDHNFETTMPEVRCFLAILMISGYLSLPRWRMMWETDSETYIETVALAMRRNRFELLKRYAHFADNSALVKGDKFAKMRPLMAMLNEKCLLYAQLVENLCIDESMIPYFGRHGAKQFLRGKPIRFGYKVWCLCDRFGYLIQFEPYQGKQENRTNLDLGVGGSVVMDLISELPEGIPFKIYCDRFFSSLKLVDRLKEAGYGFTGTIMNNRIEKCPIPSTKEMEKKARGEYAFLKDETSNFVVTTWHDNRIVTAVSSTDPIHPIVKANRWNSQEKKKTPVNQPNLIAKYNKFMGGVDRMDQNINNYRVGIRSKKWWWPVFVFCVDLSVHNAWQLYRNNDENKELDLLSFRRKIVFTYLRMYGNPPTGGGRPKSSKELSSRVPKLMRYDRIDHWMASSLKQNRCALCKKNTTKECEKCKVHLHDYCFKQFHTE